MTSGRDASAVMLVVHGTVEDLADLPAFLTNIRRGHAPPQELTDEVHRRYVAMGGKSPLNEISRELAKKLEARLHVPVRMAARLFHPYPKDVMAELAQAGHTRIAMIPLAQHSAAVYASSVEDAAAALMDQKGVKCTVLAATNWGRNAKLSAAYAKRIVDALGDEGGKDTMVIFTAHSLPKSIIDAGDPYEREVRDAAKDIGEMLMNAPAAAGISVAVCFQSQGMSGAPGRPRAGETNVGAAEPRARVEWLGPDLKSALEAAKQKGKTRVVVAPIGFLADHVEILYDLDIEAAGWAKELGVAFARTESLNASEDLVEVLESIARPLLARLAEEATTGAEGA